MHGTILLQLGESALGCFAASPKHEHIAAEEPVIHQIPVPQALDGFATNYEGSLQQGIEGMDRWPQSGL